MVGHRLAHAKLGEMFIEIIEPREGDTETIFARSLAEHGGRDHFHHLMFETEDADKARDWLQERGVKSDQGGRVRLGYNVNFDYMGTKDDLGFWVELVDTITMNRFEFEPKSAADA